MMEIALKLPGTESLKDKRRILKSAVERTRNEFHVAVAEVEVFDVWREIERR